jgi:two-component sensor histidine kinase
MSETTAGSPLVVIGVTATHLDALAALVGRLRWDGPAPLVIAPAGDSRLPSPLGEILARRSPWPVVTVEDHSALHAGTVYVVPANRHVQITDHDLTVLPAGAAPTLPAVDRLLHGAATGDGARLIVLLVPGPGVDRPPSGRRPAPAPADPPLPAVSAPRPEARGPAADAHGAGCDPAPPPDPRPHLIRTDAAGQHRLLQGVIQAQENERRRVARELHDDIGQSLAALVLALGVIQESLPALAAREQQILEDATGLAENMMGGLRRVIADLRPPVLDDLGLVPALRHLGSDLQERSGVRVVVRADEPARRLPPAVEITLFRVAQEALTNIGKHAQARQARILLQQEPAQVTLRIADDGRGIPEDAAPPHAPAYRTAEHFGLLGMQERVALLNGVFQVESAPHQGTTVTVVLPLTPG